jgi:hypothetical protein
MDMHDEKNDLNQQDLRKKKREDCESDPPCYR